MSVSGARPGYVLAFLLSLIALLMGAHLATLIWRQRICVSYEQLLFERLQKVPEGSLRAREIRQEITAAFSGRLGDCSRGVQDYSDAADTYLAVVLSLLTGAGISAGAQRMREHDEDLVDQLMDERRRRDKGE